MKTMDSLIHEKFPWGEIPEINKYNLGLSDDCKFKKYAQFTFTGVCHLMERLLWECVKG